MNTNFKESKRILAEIKKAKNILLNCHKGPDPDSIGSALALYMVLKNMGKNVEIICPNPIFDYIKFLKNADKIKTVNFSDFDFTPYDLFITQDSGSWQIVSADENFPLPNIPIIAIDHHITNEKFGKINLIRSEISSNAELLYLILTDWGVEIDKDIALALLTGIISDTGVFRYPGITSQTFKIASKLTELGADNNLIVSKIYFDMEFNALQFYGEILHLMEFDEEHKFIWSAIPYEKFKEYGSPYDAKSMVAGAFAQSVHGANFGIIIVEDSKNKISVSLRSKKGYDISGLAVKLGGGGHESAAGASIENLEFEKAVERVLEEARKHAEKSKK